MITKLLYSFVLRFSSVQDGIFVLWNTHMRSSPPIRRSHSVGYKTDPMLVLLVAFSLVFLRKIVERLLLLRLDLFSLCMVWSRAWLCASGSHLKLLDLLLLHLPTGTLPLRLSGSFTFIYSYDSSNTEWRGGFRLNVPTAVKLSKKKRQNGYTHQKKLGHTSTKTVFVRNNFS